MKVLIVDDDALVAQSPLTILSVEADVEIVGLGRSGLEATEKCREPEFDILFMDIQMPGGNGLSAAEWILAGDVAARIAFLTIFSDDEHIVRALRMGSCGYLIKQDVAQTVPALRSVMAGACALEGEVLERSATMRLSARSEPGGPQNKSLGGVVFATLTNRGYEVVEIVAEGLDNVETVVRLFINEGMVCNYTSLILAKLSLRNRTQVAVMYYRSARVGQQSAREEADAAIAAGTARCYRGTTGLRNDLGLHVFKIILSGECRKDFKRAKKRGPDV